jgi:hypothetical protein
MDKFEQELCGNDAVKGKLDGKSKHKFLCETQWFCRTNALETIKAAFSHSYCPRAYTNKW